MKPEFYDDICNAKFDDLLKEVLGKTRKTEDKMENRVYYPRVLKGENPAW